MRKKMLCALAVLFVFASQVFAESSREKLSELITYSNQLLVTTMESPDGAIPRSLLAECDAIIFMRQYRGGFILGVKGGQGIILARDRDTKIWSPPAFISSAQGSFGFQIGGQVIDAVMLIMNKEGLDMLLKSRVKVGVDVSATAGPVGRDLGAKAGPAAGILIYSRARGLYAGASFEGGAIMINEDANASFYQIPDIKIRDILLRGKVDMPVEAEPLIDSLNAYLSQHAKEEIKKQ
jgi:SH3 domain-containing YSC84-like protein 1